MNLDFEEGTRLLKFAEKEKEDEKIFLRWVVGYEREMSYTEFRRKLFQSVGSKEKELTQEEIFSKVENILEMRL